MKRTAYLTLSLLLVALPSWAQESGYDDSLFPEAQEGIEEESVGEEALEEGEGTLEEGEETLEEGEEVLEEGEEILEEGGEVLGEGGEVAEEGEEALEEDVEEVGTAIDETAAEFEREETALPIGETALTEPEIGIEETEPVSEEPEGADLGSFVVGIHIGPSLSVFSDLGVHVMPRLEVGYNLPPLDKRFEVFATVAYTRPPADGTVEDSRLPDSGEFTFEMTQDELTVGLGVLVRLFRLGEFVNPYASIGPQVVFLKTTVNGEAAGEPFGESTETGTEWGIHGALGLELVFGPGAGFFQIGATWSDLSARITGDSNTGNLTPALGYRFMF